MSWPAVQAWREHLRGLQPNVPHLSAANARFCLESALESWDGIPDLLDGPCPEHTVMVCASTVFTAPLEWCALFLARGGRFTLKVPRGLEAWFEQVTMPGLRLEVTQDREAIHQGDRVIVMGSNATVSTVRAALEGPTELWAFGHRFSVAWWTDPASADALALDLAMYDGRGCMSPTTIYSPLPDAGPRLQEALSRIEGTLPLGTLSGLEAAKIRERIALTRVLGAVHGHVCELPLAPPRPGLCRTPTLHRCDRQAFIKALGPHRAHLSCIGTDAPLPIQGVRLAPLGHMQRPPLVRTHDGIEWTS